MPHADWKVLADIAARAPPALLTWLAEPGLLTARVREFCGDDMRFRMLGPLRRAVLPEALRARLTVTDSECLVREIEFRCDDTRIIFAQTIFPATTVAAFPWLRQLGEAPLGEALRRAGQPLTRDPLEYSQLSAGHALAEAAAGTADSDGSPTTAAWSLHPRRSGPGAPCIGLPGIRYSCRKFSCRRCCAAHAA